MIRMPIRTRRASRGLTLVEVAVSIAILATLLAAIFSLLLSTQQATMTTGMEVDLDMELRQGMRLIRRELVQSGWESSISDTADVWVHNMIPIPIPTVGSGRSTSAFGTAASSAANEVQYRQRIGFMLGDPRDTFDWTNDGGGPPSARFIRLIRVVDSERSVFKNVPGGTQTRYKLVRQVQNAAGAWVDEGFQISNVEDVTFWRQDYDTVTVQLRLMLPNPTGQGGGTAPDPIRRSATERIKVQNPSGNSN